MPVVWLLIFSHSEFISLPLKLFLLFFPQVPQVQTFRQ